MIVRPESTTAPDREILHPRGLACKLCRTDHAGSGPRVVYPRPVTIEDVILRYDRRGVSALQAHLPADFCRQAAKLLTEPPGTVLVTTGFYILKTGTPETDGPPGAVAIGRAMERLGWRVVYVTDRVCQRVMTDLAGAAPVECFPVADELASVRFAKELLDRHRPSLLISIERCGRT